jgi:proline iminopeptidase/L-proline amide hydrolase
MIHGGPGSGHAVFLPALALAGDRAVILYDQLDAGRSDAPGDPANWTIARHLGEIDAIRSTLGVSRLHILGASWGGTLALEYAAGRPSGLASTILQSPLISTRSWLADAAILRARLPRHVRNVLDGRDTSEAACDAATSAFYARHVMRRPRPAAIEAYRAALPLPFNHKVYEAMWGPSEFICTGTLRDYDGEALLARLDGRRTLFMAGRHDEARPATVASFAKRANGAEFVAIEGASHKIAMEQPRRFVETLDRWMTRHDAA